MRRVYRAFTLIELLTVMAITAIMLTLIVLPIFQSFNLTRSAQAFADAQDKARLLVERISREIGNAVSVRDSADTVARIPVVDAQGKPTGASELVTLPYTKLDLISPAQGDPSLRGLGGGFINPKTGKEDPTLTRPIGDIRLPVSQGMTLTRWWVGLNRPIEDNGSLGVYNEPYTGLLMVRNGGRDNLFVLRRAEIQPYIYRLRKDGASNTRAWRPNLAYFHSDDDKGDGVEFDTRIIDLDDPMFFVPDGQYLPEDAKDIPGNRVADNQKNVRVANWAKASVVQTEISRYDMVRPALVGSPARLDPNAPSKLVPLVQFRPTRVSNAPAAGNAAAQPGQAVVGLDQIGPDTYQTERGLWTNAIVRYYPAAFAPGGLELASVNQLGGITISNGAYNPAGLDGHAAPANDFALFDLVNYERMTALGYPYPFTSAAISADVSNLPPAPPGRLWTPEVAMRQLFTPFRVVTRTGKIVTSFPIEQVGTTALSGAPRPNLPIVTVTGALSPALDNGAGAEAHLSPLSDNSTGKYEVNRLLNYLWNAYPAYQGSWQRFIDLRFVPNEDGTYSPLCPLAKSGSVTGFSFKQANGGSLNRVRIVPGSDEIYGPDQTPGPGYGTQIRYSRTTGNPGPNQYKLVYADIAEPTNAAGQVDYSVLGFTGLPGTFDPNVYDENNIMSAVVQPRFKAGYLQLCSDPNVPIPAGSITARYRFQFNGPNDSFVVDHDTREVMQILLTIKNYPQSNAPAAQTVTLKSTATLRNALR